MSAADNDLIAVYVVTYRRNNMLRRALRSVVDQTYKNFVVRVVNDDPADVFVDEIVAGLKDPRVRMFSPTMKRGATRSFNLQFEETEATYSALLEDDNWWEPDFLSRMRDTLMAHPDSPVAVGNETIWKELPGDQWENTGNTIWNFRDVREYTYTLAAICGGAKICNSSSLYRVKAAYGFRTPDTIPVDVSEHFRERWLPAKIVLHGKPMANFSVTLHSTRGNDFQWGQRQIILIVSAFRALGDSAQRAAFARVLWEPTMNSPTSPRAVSLVCAGLADPSARALLKAAPLAAFGRTAVWMARSPRRASLLGATTRTLSAELEFLVNAPLTQELARGFGR